MLTNEQESFLSVESVCDYESLAHGPGKPRLRPNLTWPHKSMSTSPTLYFSQNWPAVQNRIRPSISLQILYYFDPKGRVDEHIIYYISCDPYEYLLNAVRKLRGRGQMEEPY